MFDIVYPSLVGHVDFGLGTGGTVAGPGAYEDTLTGGPWVRIGARDLVITWVSESAPGTTFQVYIDRRLAWSGTTTRAVLPRTARPVTVEVVAVSPGSGRVDFSGSFPPLPGRSITLEWSGGRYLSPDLVAFRIYRGAVPGGSVDYSGKPLARISWAGLGAPQDGFGIGGFGRGGFGLAEVRYSWTSGPMPAGAWRFGVVPEDASGALGTPLEATFDHNPAPEPPGQRPGGSRLAISLDPTTRIPTLSWLASPG